MIEIYQEIYSEELCSITHDFGGNTLREIIKSSNIQSFDEKSYKKMSEDERNALSKTAMKYFRLLNEIVKVLARENATESTFYNRLYQKVFESDLFSQNSLERGMILFLLARRTKLLPYYQAQNTIEMSEGEADAVFDRIVDRVENAMFMLNERFSSSIEEAAELVAISNKLENDTEKTVYWATIISRLRDEENSSED